jgi:predicted signal transduction protein with EAL and GGDEF domain
MLVRVNDEMAAEVNGHVLARLGGDEFAVVLPRVATCDDATIVAEKLLRALDRPFIVENHTLYVRMSIGMALYPEHGQDALTLFRQADVAMYHAKQNGLGYAFFNRAHHQERLASAELERELHQAIDLGNLELYYQPKINVKDGSVCGAEALLRWRHPQKGVIAPDKFIPLAEQSGLIHPLTTWVLNRAIEDCASWHRAGVAAGVAINISAVSLRDPQFVEHVAAALNRCKLPPTLVTLELTESAVMREPNHSLLVMTRLDQMGVRLSIDDFGTGYSSLSYLKQLPVDEIKIDRSFVMEMNSNDSDSVIVRATIDLAHNLGLRVVAEGVENRETLLMLSRLGCDLAQGYFISHPIPCDTLVTWMTTVKSCYTNPDRDCSAPGGACFPACG